MAQDSSAPATKEDVGLLMERMGEMDMKLERKADASEVKIWIQTEGEKTRKYLILLRRIFTTILSVSTKTAQKIMSNAFVGWSTKRV